MQNRHLRSLFIAGLAGLVVITVGVLVWIGWLTDTAWLTRARLAWTPMVPMTATAFCLSGSALLAITGMMATPRDKSERWHQIAMVIGVVVALIGARRLIYYWAGWSTNVDMLGLDPQGTPGQMAPFTAVGFFLAGTALAMTAKKRFYPVAQWMAALVLFIGWIGIARYLYGGETTGVFFRMAMPTAVMFAVLGIGVFYARPDGGFMQIWNSDTAGGLLVRRLFPTALIVPVAVGWLRLQGERAGWYGLETGLAIFAMSNVLIFTVLVWHTASRLHVQDNKRREAEHTVRVEKDFSAAVIDSLPGVLYLYNQEGKFLRWNKNFEKVTGYSGAEIAQMKPHEFIAPSDHEALAARIGDVFVRGSSHVEACVQSKSGVVTPYFFTGVTVKVGGEDCLVGVGIDISERVQAEQAVRALNETLELKVAQRTRELQTKNRELETFTYSVSHDLKAPLRGIDGYSRLLLEEYHDRLDDEGRKFLNYVRQASLQMGQLIEDLLAYSQLERRALTLSAIRPQAVLDAMPLGYMDDIESRNIAYTVSLPDVAVRADPNGLAQVMRNLLDNALKFTRATPAPAIEIAGRIEGAKYILWVKDNGIGFDMKFTDRIFDIFQRLHRAEDYPGTGIGLAIVRKAMERMGGRVWAESTPGQGATFFLEIPIHTA
ncbi:MAG: PAS domain S-box protein [Opitutaceae bacterium]|nr:PAS domain S-box protein [Opitutaceae bacterium]